MKNTRSRLVVPLVAALALRIAAEPAAFPYELPDKKPKRPLSAAMARLYDDYLAPTPEANELYSTFKFPPLEGLDYHNADGTISRRDPSKAIRVNAVPSGIRFAQTTGMYEITPQDGSLTTYRTARSPASCSSHHLKA